MDAVNQTDDPDAGAGPVPDVMVLAAGLGRRMRPLSLATPKPLIEVAGKPLLAHALDAARAEGLSRFVINAHHLADRMERYVRALGPGHVLSAEETLLDTGGGMKKALPILAGDPVLALNADTFWRPGADRPLMRMRALHARGRADIVLLCVAPDRALGFRNGADYMLAADGTVSAALGRPVIYAGAALIGRHLFAETPDGAFSLFRLFEAARTRGRLAGVLLEAQWYHVGDPAALDQAERALEADR